MSIALSPTGSKPVPIKLIVTALLFPLYLALALPGVYLAAFHQPAPSDMKVEVIAAGSSASAIQQELAAKAGDALDVSSAASVAAARHDVSTMAVRAAYNPVTGELFIASAGSALAAQAVESVFTQVADQTKQKLSVHDLAPLPTGDSVGVSLMFLGLAGILAGFITATVLNLAAPGLRLKSELAIIGGTGVVAGFVTTFIGFTSYGAFSAHLIGAGLVVAAGTVTAALVQSGGIKLIGPAMTIIGVTLFVILGIPSSGAAVPVDMTPSFFQVLHGLLPTSGTLDGLRRVLYFGSSGLSHDLSILVLWALIGAAGIWIASLRTKKTPALAEGLVVPEEVAA